MQKDKTGITRPIICKSCGKRVGFIKLKPAIQELLQKKKRMETFSWILFIALVTQIIAQIISDGLFKIIGY